MSRVLKSKNIVFKIFSLLFIFQTILCASNNFDEQKLQTNQHQQSLSQSSEMLSAKQSGEEYVEIRLNRFGGMSMTIMILLTSLLGVYFIREEFTNLFE